jgi:hypothetical protein
MKVTPSTCFHIVAVGGLILFSSSVLLAQSASRATPSTATATGKEVPAATVNRRVTFKNNVGGKNASRVEVEVMALANAKRIEDPTAIVPNPDWVDKIKVTVTLAYKTKPKTLKARGTAAPAGATALDALATQYITYRASSTIMTLQRNKTGSVFFYLPGELHARDGLGHTPDSYVVDLEVDGTAVTLSKNAVSPDLKTAEAIDLLKSLADKQSADTAGILRTQSQVAGLVNDPEWLRAPTLLREDSTRQ